MAVSTATFETGSNGATIATSDTGSATAWNNVVIGSNVTATYDTAHPAHGSLSAKFAAASSAAISYLEWTGLGLTGTHYGRLYLYMTAIPTGSAARLFTFMRASDTSLAVECRLNTAGKIVAGDGVGAITTAANALSTSTLYRIEWKVVVGLGTAGSVEIHVYPGDGGTEDTNLGATVAAGNTRSQNDIFRVGFPEAAPGVFTWWCDDVVAGAASFPGPATAAPAPPALGLLGVGY